MKRKLMILGAGFFQLPAILKAKNLGLFTIVCSCYADDPGMSVADKSYIISTINKEEILKIAKKEKIDGIMTISSEAATPTVSFVAEKIGLPGYSYRSAKIIANKYLLRNFLKKNNFLSPEFGKALNLREANKIYKKISFLGKVVMKPLESSGSRGICLINNKRDIDKNFEKSKNFSFFEKGVIMEQYLNGIEIGGECLIYKGEIVFFNITNKYKNNYFVPIGHSLPSKLPVKIKIKVEKMINRFVKSLNLQNGALNFDVMIVGEDPIIIELGGRLGGNCLPDLMTYSTGVDTIENVILMSLGEKPEINQKFKKGGFGYKILGSYKKGFLKSINIDEIKKKIGTNIVEIKCNKNIKDKIEIFDQGSHQIGYVKVRGESPEAIEDIFTKIDKLLKLELF